MKDWFNEILRYVLAGLCAACGFLFGDMNGVMIALIVLIILDYVTGVLAAVVEHKLSSEIGAKGIAKKVFMLLIVAVANIVDINVIGGDMHTLKSVAIVFYIANEAISLLENAGRLGVPLPKKVLDVLAQLKKENDEGKK
jgi:toxin secretion/phage lysis holin